MKGGRRARRGAVAVAAAATFAAVSIGAAATLGGVTTRVLGAGQATVSSCDNDGVTVTYATSAGAVQSMTVAGIASACTGGSLKAVLAGSNGASVGAGGPVAVSGTTASVSLTPQPQAANVAAVHVVIEGP